MIAGIHRVDQLEQLLGLVISTQSTTWTEFWVTAIEGNPFLSD